MKLRGKIALVTGAAQGIGQAIAVRFAQEGAKVAVNDIKDDVGRETVKTITEAGGEAAYFHADVSNSAEVQAMIRQVSERFKGLHILVNNAAYAHWGSKPVTELSEEEWDRTLDVTLKGAFLCSKYTIPEMVKSGGGSIINIDSVAGVFGFPSESAYMAAKGGLLQLTKSMAIDYAAVNIRVNAIAPGWTATPMNAEMRKDPNYLALALRGPVIKRPGKPEEVAAAAVYFASEEAGYATGAVLVMDGGWSLRSALGRD
jgi:NAD(P)-dependent dehydrogenase (short-subunit alcohol dehydrogenase family)